MTFELKMRYTFNIYFNDILGSEVAARGVSPRGGACQRHPSWGGRFRPASRWRRGAGAGAARRRGGGGRGVPWRVRSDGGRRGRAGPGRAGGARGAAERDGGAREVRGRGAGTRAARGPGPGKGERCRPRHERPSLRAGPARCRRAVPCCAAPGPGRCRRWPPRSLGTSRRFLKVRGSKGGGDPEPEPDPPLKNAIIPPPIRVSRQARGGHQHRRPSVLAARETARTCPRRSRRTMLTMAGF